MALAKITLTDRPLLDTRGNGLGKVRTHARGRKSRKRPESHVQLGRLIAVPGLPQPLLLCGGQQFQGVSAALAPEITSGAGPVLPLLQS